MKKLICTSLLFFSASVFADAHIIEALEHANEAVAHGKDGHTTILVGEVKVALEHTLAASITAKGASKIHLDAATMELQEAIDHCELGHVGAATKHARVAIGHIKDSNK
jgi:hypothetical protein